MKRIFILFILLLLCITGCADYSEYEPNDDEVLSTVQASDIAVDSIPEYSGQPFVELEQNQPNLIIDNSSYSSYENYSELDALGRVGIATACIGQDLMPTEDRESISEIKPTAWHSVKYDIVPNESLYNRCHLIAFELSGENANPNNLMTGTRYLNVEGMLPFENQIAEYVKETGNHVLYKVTPVFYDDELLARGVQLEALSVEDNGEGVSFNVFCYNIQPGVTIDYQTGDSTLESKNEISSETTQQEYVLNTNSKKFHLPSCSSVAKISEKNKQVFIGSREELLTQYSPCSICNP